MFLAVIMNKKVKLILKVFIAVLVVLFFLLFLWFIERAILPRQVDDVNPLINCEQDIIGKSSSLAVIPIFHNSSIAENKTWCNYILSLNKTLIMHGVYHTYMEFDRNVSIEEVKSGMEEFKKCFGFYPKIFEAPQLALSSRNAEILRGGGLGLRGYPFTLTHKVYHCNDTGRLSNRFVDIF